MILIVLIGWIIGAGVLILDMEKQQLDQGRLLPRPETGEGDREEVLQVESPYGTENVTVLVGEQQLETEEIRQKLQEIAEELDMRILGENISLDQVHDSLNLMRELEDFPVCLEWSVPEDGYLYEDGSLNKEKIPAEGVLVKLRVRLTWNEEVVIKDFYVKLLVEQQTGRELFLETLHEEVQKKGIESQYANALELPEEAAGVSLVWKRPLEKRGIWICLLSLAGSLLWQASLKRREQDNAQRRRVQMEMDYPEIISKLKLYMESGLTCRSAWMKIVDDYQKKQKRIKNTLRFAYEEMVKTGYEMQSGVGELQAYERFGERCGVPCYRKLMGLLIQNVRKGNRGLGQLLEAEMWQAFERRKALAQKQGEEAGTKLLLPMMGMLGIVMVIVIAPAFMSMQI